MLLLFFSNVDSICTVSEVIIETYKGMFTYLTYVFIIRII